MASEPAARGERPLTPAAARSLRILQIGLGRFGQSHLRSWRKLGVDLRVADRDPARLAGPEPSSTDWRTLLDDADGVDVVTPAPVHAEIARAALERGKHVLVEKPLAPTSREAAALARLARERGAVLQVGHVFRFAPEAVATEAALRGGSIGRLLHASAGFASFKRPRADGGLALSDGIHFVDLLSRWIGRAPTAVTAVLRDHLGRGLDDFAWLALEYGDVPAVIEATCFRPEPRRDVQLVGTEGGLVCDFLGAGVRRFPQRHRAGADGAWSVEQDAVEIVPVQGGEPLLAELGAFAAACADGRASELAADGIAGAAAVAVIEAAERSAREGCRVRVETPAP